MSTKDSTATYIAVALLHHGVDLASLRCAVNAVGLEQLTVHPPAPLRVGSVGAGLQSFDELDAGTHRRRQRQESVSLRAVVCFRFEEDVLEPIVNVKVI